ncbi:hypothetical protein G7085_15180 [Tessaracoccus sp. HDW20]|nr:hypothetical protein [Tessaracoccus coleopterorum]
MRQKLLLATPLPATWMSNVIIHNVYIKFYTDVIGLSPQYVGWVYLVFNLWNILNDPIFGVMLDKMRYRPGGASSSTSCGAPSPDAHRTGSHGLEQPSWPQGVIFAVFLLELFLFDVASTLYLISAVSYGYLAAPSREDRIDVEVVKAWVGNITSAFATILATQLLVGDAITEHTTVATILMGSSYSTPCSTSCPRSSSRTHPSSTNAATPVRRRPPGRSCGATRSRS